MGLPNTFATIATGAQEPGSALDANFNAVGQMGVTYCTAAGTNAITLTPVNTPGQTNVTAYNNLQLFSFVPVATSTGLVTAQVGALAFIPIYIGDVASQAGANSIRINQPYLVQFLTALNAGAGGFIVLGGTTTTPFTPVISPQGGGVSPARPQNISTGHFIPWSNQNQLFTADVFGVLSTDPYVQGTNVTIGGTVTVGDKVGVTITFTGGSGSPISVQYTVITGDTLNSIAAGLALALNNTATFATTNAFFAQSFSGSAIFNIQWPVAITVSSIVANNSGGATETTTIAAINTGFDTDPLFVLQRDAGVADVNGSGIGAINWRGHDSAGLWSGTNYASITGFSFTGPLGRIALATTDPTTPTAQIQRLYVQKGIVVTTTAGANPPGGDLGHGFFNTIPGGGYEVAGGLAQAGPSAQWLGSLSGINANTAAAPAAVAGTLLQLVQADTTAAFLGIDTFAAAGSILLRRADTTNTSKSAVQSGETIGALQAAGFGATVYGSPRSFLQIQAAENWSDTAQGTQMQFRLTPPTTTTPGNVLILNAASAAIANQIAILAQATGVGPSLSASGTDTNIDLVLNAKGTGVTNLGTTTATTATAGAQTLPANPAGFINIKVNGTAQKIPFYNT